MMKAKGLELARQRDDLVAQIVVERSGIALRGASLRLAAQIIDKVRDGIQYLKSHPEVLLLPIVITVVTRPRRLLALAISGFGLWQLARKWRRRILS
jgi:hypothetical protein